jgi:hypothetical protein
MANSVPLPRPFRLPALPAPTLEVNDWLARSLSRGATTPILRHPRVPDAGSHPTPE